MPTGVGLWGGLPQSPQRTVGRLLGVVCLFLSVLVRVRKGHLAFSKSPKAAPDSFTHSLGPCMAMRTLLSFLWTWVLTWGAAVTGPH